jgi:hypothetical protein
MHYHRLGVLLTVAALGCGMTAAQSPSQADIGALGEAFRDNQLALREYTWKARTQVTVDDALDSRFLFRVSHDADGRVVRELLENLGDGGKRRSKKKQKKFEELVAELRELLDSYTSTPPRRAREAYARARGYEDPPGSETVRLQMRGVVYEGDSMDVWVDGVTGLPSRFEVFTALYGEAVAVSVRFHQIVGAEAVPAFATVRTEDKEKKVEIRVEMFEHARR